MRDDASAAERLRGLLIGNWVSQAVTVAAELGLADLMAQRPKTPAALARCVGADESAMRRLLRALASVGVFAETVTAQGEPAWESTPLSEVLRTDVENSLHAMALFYGQSLYPVWADLGHSIRTGKPALEHVHGMPVFDWFRQHPGHARLFERAMTSAATMFAQAVASAHDFSRYRDIVDVGGAQGAVLAAVLAAHPGLYGVLFDRPDMGLASDAPLHDPELAGRWEQTAGDFFISVPSGRQAYLLSRVLHDWDDDQCLTILGRCHEAMPRDGRLLVVECILPPGNTPSFAKWLDLNMLAVSGGRERSEQEFSQLLSDSGFHLLAMNPAGPDNYMLEAVPH